MTRTRKQDRPRVKHLRRKHDAHVVVVAAGQHPHPRLTRSQSAAFDYLLAFDPTPNAAYLSSVVKWFVDGRILLEDGRPIRNLLNDFHCLKHLLPIEQRNVVDYETPGSLARALEPVRGPRRLVLPSEPGQLVASGTDWTLHRVTEPEQAKQWARGTSWCTGKLDTAEGYLVSGPMHVLVHQGVRHQIQMASAQFMDVHNEPVTDLSDLPEDALHALAAICMEENRPHWIGAKDASLPFQRAEVLVAARREIARRTGAPRPIPHNRKACWLHRDTGVFVDLIGAKDENVTMTMIHPDRSVHDDERRRISGQLAWSIGRETSLDTDCNCIVVDELMWAVDAGIDQKDVLLVSDDDTWMPVAIAKASSREGWPMDPIVMFDIRDGRHPERVEIRNRSDFTALDEQLRSAIRKLHRIQEPSMASVVELGIEILDDNTLYEWQKGQSPSRDELACLLVRNEADIAAALPVLEMLFFCQDYVDDMRGNVDVALSPVMRQWLDDRSLAFEEKDAAWNAARAAGV